MIEEAAPPTINIVNAMGISIVLGLVLLIILIVLLIFQSLSLHNYKLRRQYFKLKRKIFYNVFIRYFLQCDLKIQVAHFSTIYYL